MTVKENYTNRWKLNYTLELCQPTIWNITEMPGTWVCMRIGDISPSSCRWPKPAKNGLLSTKRRCRSGPEMGKQIGEMRSTCWIEGMKRSKCENKKQLSFTIKIDIAHEINDSDIVRIYATVVWCSVFFRMSNFNVFVWSIFCCSRIVFTQSYEISNKSKTKIELKFHEVQIFNRISSLNTPFVWNAMSSRKNVSRCYQRATYMIQIGETYTNYRFSLKKKNFKIRKKSCALTTIGIYIVSKSVKNQN